MKNGGKNGLSCWTTRFLDYKSEKHQRFGLIQALVFFGGGLYAYNAECIVISR